jgi:hypothetical protein
MNQKNISYLKQSLLEELVAEKTEQFKGFFNDQKEFPFFFSEIIGIIPDLIEGEETFEKLNSFLEGKCNKLMYQLSILWSLNKSESQEANLLAKIANIWKESDNNAPLRTEELSAIIMIKVLNSDIKEFED